MTSVEEDQLLMKSAGQAAAQELAGRRCSEAPGLPGCVGRDLSYKL